MGLFPHCGHIFGMKKKIKYQKGATITLAPGAQRQTSQRHCTGSRGTLGMYTQREEKGCHCPMNCLVYFAILCPKYTTDFQNFWKLEEKRGTEKILRVAISTVVRHSLWIEIWDCISPEIFSQQLTGIIFPFGPEGKDDRSWFFLCKSLCMIRAKTAESLESDAHSRLRFIKEFM